MSSLNTTEVQRTILYQTDAFEIVSIVWSNAVLSPVHNHGWSQCHVLVQEGVFENHLQAGAKSEIRKLEVGQVLSTPVGAAHEMRCLTPTGKTLHVYTPRIKIHRNENHKFNSALSEELPGSLALGEAVPFEKLREILSLLEKNTVETRSPYFMNQLFSGVHPQALLADDLISRTKITMATQEASRAFTLAEAEVIEQLGSLIGWKPNNRDGLSVPGGSAANFMAVQLAKHRNNPETKVQGLKNTSYKIFVSQEAHYSFKKAAVAMGLGSAAVITVGVDSAQRMDTSLLERAILQAKEEGHTPLMVCATAGTTVSGAFDPILEIHSLCELHKIWLHVDGAWGGPALFSQKTKSLVKGIELADSVTFDAHKLFGAGLTCSFILTRHSGLLLEANDVSGADYLFHDSPNTVDHGRMAWQCGRRGDALSFWALWKNLGTAGLGDFVDRLLGVRNQTLRWIETESRLELVYEPTFLNLCVRVNPPNNQTDSEWSKKVREKLIEKNLAMVNYSTNEGGTFLRLILANPQITAGHVEQILTFALAAE